MRIRCGVCNEYRCRTRGHKVNEAGWIFLGLCLAALIIFFVGIGWGWW